MIERFNQTILNHLSLFVSRNQTDWDTHLPLFLLACRSAEPEVTGLTPVEMLLGRTLRLPCDILFGRPSKTPSSPNEYMKNLEVRLESVHAFARERIKLASERMKTRYDSRATDHHFKEGDLIWMYTICPKVSGHLQIFTFFRISPEWFNRLPLNFGHVKKKQ
ncbi:hypothetical protein AVEN_26374-1 [Araneus ventricosus]|uniref:Integrase catalytic domain-containing protein n=1 Tax=Araneus ventricosus TaxID=182803 RepID=A0A4Y2T6R1_ARAVE|nr:hypothetical protein AVEN_26374-1 [Araneus ventricosus]